MVKDFPLQQWDSRDPMYYHNTLWMKQVNIGIEAKLKLVVIGYYWDERTYLFP
jgi:hypothetical protein